MNARALKILVASQNAGRCFIVSLVALLLLTLCGNITTTAHGLPANNWSPNLVQAPSSGDDVSIPNSGAYPVTDNFAMTPINNLLCHHRIRTRGRFASNFQNDFTVARNGHIPPSASGIVIASGEVAQPVMFLNTATARGPPSSGDQSLYLFDNALDRSAPILSEFHFHDSSSARNATRLLIQSSMVSRAGTLLVAAISVKYNPTVHQNEQL